MAPLISGLNNATDLMVPCHHTLGLLSSPKKNGPPCHCGVTGLTWPLKSGDGFCARVRERNAAADRGEGCMCVCVPRRNRNGSAKKKHYAGWVFVIASSPRWMAAAAVRADSCRPERMGKNKLQEGRRARWGESRAARERFAQCHNLEKCTRV